MSTETGSFILRDFLLKSAEGKDQFGTHSAKATLLSWLAKAGVDLDTRRMLGYHAAPKDKSVIEYSRDAMAQPLREAGKVLMMIRRGEFRPDATRSGRWLADKPQEYDEEDSEHPAPETEEEDQPEQEDEEADKVDTDIATTTGSVDEPPPEGVIGNRATKVQHRAGADQGTIVCGHTFTIDAVSSATWLVGWGRCRRSECFPCSLKSYASSSASGA